MSEIKGAERALTPGLCISPCMKIQKIRELPVPGELLVKEGQWVSGADRIAQAFLPGELSIVRISERLGIEPFEVMKGLRVKEGDSVKENQLLCEHVGLFGLFRNRFHSPLEGRVEFVAERTGHIGIRLAPIPIHLDAYISGKVVSTQATKSITIETQAAYVQGIFGVGGERQGTLHLLDVSVDQIVTEADLPKDLRGKILVGGTRPQLEVLTAAQRGGAVGLVVGAIDDHALAGYLGYDLGIALTGDEKVSMSIIITEGFGAIPMSDRVVELLGAFKGQPASINGATQVRAGAVRPEIITGFQKKARADAAQTQVRKALSVGSDIRMIRVPYFGQKGVVIKMPPETRRIETGAMARVLEARLESGEVVTVPRANVELL